MTVADLKRGDRFRAYPGRAVKAWDSDWVMDPVYKVTKVNGTGPDATVWYGLHIEGRAARGDFKATVAYLTANGLEVLP